VTNDLDIKLPILGRGETPPTTTPPTTTPPTTTPPTTPGGDTSSEAGNMGSNDASAATVPQSATTNDLLSSAPATDNVWQEYKNPYDGFKIIYPPNWAFSNSTVAPSPGTYAAAHFCPMNPGIMNASAMCEGDIEGHANDGVWVIVHPNLTQFQFSGDNATMLVEQFMHQDMNRTATESGWNSYEVINRTIVMINATDEGNGLQTRIVSLPAIIIDYRHAQGANEFRNVEMYTIFAGKGYVVKYLPGTDIELTRNIIQENAQGFYPPFIQYIFSTFSPMRSVR
jgi:hypothetical protein